MARPGENRCRWRWPASTLAAGAFAPFEIGGRWGKPWGTTWFRQRGVVPEAWSGQTVEALVDFSTGVGAGFQSEGLLYRTDGGGPVRGIHPMHQAVPIALVADDDGCGGRAGGGGRQPGRGDLVPADATWVTRPPPATSCSTA